MNARFERLVLPALLVPAAVVGSLVLLSLLAACGGSSSETPYPLEPLPQSAHSGGASGTGGASP